MRIIFRFEDMSHWYHPRPPNGEFVHYFGLIATPHSLPTAERFFGALLELLKTWWGHEFKLIEDMRLLGNMVHLFETRLTE